MTSQKPPNSFSIAIPLRDGFAAARTNTVPGIILWCMAVILVVLFYKSSTVRELLNEVAELKTRFGFAYSAISTTVFGALIPFLYMRTTRQGRRISPWAFLPFYLALWAYRGIEVDLLYRLQGHIFGIHPRVEIIVPKVLCDQFLYNPLWAAPTTVVLFLWRDKGFVWSATKASLSGAYLWNQTIRMLVSTWMVWIPAVSVIYSFPSALQIPLFNIVLCFWMLLLATLTSGSAKQERG